MRRRREWVSRVSAEGGRQRGAERWAAAEAVAAAEGAGCGGCNTTVQPRQDGWWPPFDSMWRDGCEGTRGARPLPRSGTDDVHRGDAVHRVRGRCT